MEIHVNTLRILAMGIGVNKWKSLLTETEILQYKFLFRTFYSFKSVLLTKYSFIVMNSILSDTMYFVVQICKFEN